MRELRKRSSLIFPLCVLMIAFLAIVKDFIPGEQQVNVLLFAGSTRQESLNRKLIQAVAKNLEEMKIPSVKLNLNLIELKDYPIPFYNGDEELLHGMPENAKKIRNLIQKSHFIFIASPNYSGSLPALLKNLLDWTSRSEEGTYSLAPFKDKTFVLLSAGPGASGGIKGLDHLRSILEASGGSVFPRLFALPYAQKSFDEQDDLIDPTKQLELQNLLQALKFH